MVVRIAKTFDFDAAHWLPHVDKNHKCYRMHGHTYRVEIICEGEVDERGMVVDYAQIALEWFPIHGIIDHQVLNEIPGLENPTTEILAPWILAQLNNIPVVAVRVYESSTTWCEAACREDSQQEARILDTCPQCKIIQDDNPYPPPKQRCPGCEAIASSAISKAQGK